MAAAFFAGCGGDAGEGRAGSDIADAGGGADALVLPASALQIGSGEVSFEPIEEGQALPLYAGTQGGYHVWLSFRAPLAPGLVTMELDLVPVPASRESHSELTIPFEEVAGEPALAEFIGWPAQILDPECAVQQPVQVHARFVDSRGVSVEADIALVPTPPASGFSIACPP
jgi:hypothetical protein